jgi:hypothetical protein
MFFSKYSKIHKDKILKKLLHVKIMQLENLKSSLILENLFHLIKL